MEPENRIRSKPKNSAIVEATILDVIVKVLNEVDTVLLPDNIVRATLETIEHDPLVRAEVQKWFDDRMLGSYYNVHAYVSYKIFGWNSNFISYKRDEWKGK